MHAQRTDILTGRKLPEYGLAVRGSFLFYEGRLDRQVEKINYMFASMVSVNIDNLILIRKLLPPQIWALVYKAGNTIQGLDPVMAADVVKTYAVSFIPLNPNTHEAEPRVHIMLDDLYLIQWKTLKHWLADKTQKEHEADMLKNNIHIL